MGQTHSSALMERRFNMHCYNSRNIGKSNNDDSGQQDYYHRTTEHFPIPRMIR